MELTTFKAPTFRSDLIQMQVKTPIVLYIQLDLVSAHAAGSQDCTSVYFGQ